MDFKRRIIVFAIAAIAAPATMVIGAHLSFPVSNKSFPKSTLKTVSNSPAEMSFVNVKLNDGPAGNDNTTGTMESRTVSYPVEFTSFQNHGLPLKTYSGNKNPYFRLFYFSGKSVYETSLADLLKK
ncbi:MAG TPA: hypothetical protein VFJ43_15720 [Bacteroidia bacterium]|nr:hypothetical protein [Bacteroidia bacterium]